MFTQADIDRLDWFHNFDFPDGLKAISREQENRDFHQRLWSFISDRLSDLNFQGKTVIDIGCWDGYFSFLAERLGASNVLSVDDFSQNWGAKNCYLLAQSLYKSQTTLLPDVSVYNLSSRIQESFDIVLFLGVYYHLHAPYAALAQVRGLCHPNSLVVIEGDCFHNETDSYARIVLDKPSWPKFVPTTQLLRQMLHSCYFEIDQMYFLNQINSLPAAPAIASTTPRKSFEHLLKDQMKSSLKSMVKPLLHPFLPPPVLPLNEALGPVGMMDRVLIVAKPIHIENQAHYYQPPFGLERFDLRSNPTYPQDFQDISR